jgi:hypothetical protein
MFSASLDEYLGDVVVGRILLVGFCMHSAVT